MFLSSDTLSRTSHSLFRVNLAMPVEAIHRCNIELFDEDAEISFGSRYHTVYHAQKHTLSTHDYCIFCIPFINTSSLSERTEFLFICKCFYTCFYCMKIANLINVAQII